MLPNIYRALLLNTEDTCWAYSIPASNSVARANGRAPRMFALKLERLDSVSTLKKTKLGDTYL